MEVRFDPCLQEKLTRVAAEQGRDSEALVVEAVERMLSHDEWFLGKWRRVLPPLIAVSSSIIKTSGN